MERKNKACWNCGNYKAYYTKGLCHKEDEQRDSKPFEGNM